MIVLGDAGDNEHLSAVALQIRNKARAARMSPRDLDRLRSLLILCGELEQAAEDAVLSAILSAAGWNVTRVTARPQGDPFARRSELPRFDPFPSLAIVVDEGPGLSGSSMASIAQCLLDAGVQRSGIAFFPGAPQRSGQCWHRTSPLLVVLNPMLCNSARRHAVERRNVDRRSREDRDLHVRP